MPQSRKGVLALYLLFGVALFWALASHFHPGSSWRALAAFDHEYTAAVVGLVLINLAIRFMRWQFLLRKIGVRIPTRASLGIFLATLSLIITPLYIGELLKPYLIKKRFGAQMRRTVAVVAMERYLDALALVALALCDLDGLRRIGAWAILPAVIAVPLVATAVSPRLRLASMRLFSRLRFARPTSRSGTIRRRASSAETPAGSARGPSSSRALTIVGWVFSQITRFSSSISMLMLIHSLHMGATTPRTGSGLGAIRMSQVLNTSGSRLRVDVVRVDEQLPGPRAARCSNRCAWVGGRGS